ncbi:MAG: hypothetical protein K0S98_1466 [Propionibacteriaceae bacterium]|jgi:hypothetical protein|nr:hypothetical protein [Propionibacteriaceae bacterium]
MLDAAIRAQAAPLLHPAEHLDQEVDEPLGTVHDDVGVHAEVPLWWLADGASPPTGQPRRMASRLPPVAARAGRAGATAAWRDGGR